MADEPKTLDDMELFRAALTPKPPPEEPPAPVEEPPPAEPEPQPQPPPEPIRTTEESVPSWRLREEAEQRRLAEDRARLLEQRLQEVAQHFQQQNQQKPEAFFEQPAQAVQALVMQHLQPYAEETRRNMMYLGKMVASAMHGGDKVDQAEQAFLRARDEQSLDPADYERVVQSPNRYDAVVQWHRRQSVVSTVGDDPAAWFDKQLEAKMADPKFQASLLERVRGSAAARPTATELPPSLSRTTAVAGNSAPSGDLSDASLWAAVRRR